MRFRKRIAALLCAAMVFNTVAPVYAGSVKADIENADYTCSSQDDRYVVQETSNVQEIKAEIQESMKGMDHTSGTWDEAVEFIMLADSTLSNNKYMLKSVYGSVSQDDYAYMAEKGIFKYTLADQQGKKIKGLKKEDILWRTYVYEKKKRNLIKSPESVPVHNGVIECGEQYGRYDHTIFVFAIYDGMVAMSTLEVTRPTKYFGQQIGKKFVTKATASCNYRVGDLIDIDNVQKLVGTTSENAIIYYFGREKVSGNKGYSYNYWAVPETAAIYATPDCASDLIDHIRKGAYAIKVNKMKNIDAVYNDFGSVVAFRPKKKGIYKVTYIVPDGYNKKFTVKIRVTD